MKSGSKDVLNFTFQCLWGLTLATALLHVEATAAIPRSRIESIMRSANWTTGTVLSYPGQEAFSRSTERWTVYEPPSYSASVTVETEADVVKAVKLARSHRFPFLATGGRHGYNTDLGNLQNGLAIDLSNLNQVTVDSDARTVTVGPGARFRDMVGPVSDAGFLIQTGTCSCPGMIGVTIGGGIGRLEGIYGLLLDALTSARLVTANGSIVHVSAEENSDLFWGIRGAGANFGIITQATYGIHPNPIQDNFTTVDVVFPAEKSTSYFSMLESVVQDVNRPAALSIDSGIIYNTTTNQLEIEANWVYYGPRDEALQAMAPMLALDPPVIEVSEVRWEALNEVAGFGADTAVCTPGQNNDIYSANLLTLNATTLESTFSKMSTFYASNPEARGSSVLIESFPNEAATAIDDSVAVFPWRDTVSYVLMEFTWDKTSSTAENTKTAANNMGLELRSDFAASSGYTDGLAVYGNYAHGDETLEQIFTKANLPRLAALKAAWDPDNVFAYNNPLPTSYK